MEEKKEIQEKQMGNPECELTDRLTDKRLVFLSGHYGSGKSNVAVNLAFDMKRRFFNTSIADLDIVNPYFRSADSEKEFQEAGIRLISCGYANTNLDMPSIPQDVYAMIDDRTMHCVIDVGGDDRGALALGRLTPMVLSEQNYDMFMVINCFRPLTPDAKSIAIIRDEIEYACGLPFTGLINNSNLGEYTTAEDVLSSMAFAKDCEKELGLPLAAVAVEERLYAELGETGMIPSLYPLRLQNNKCFK